MRLDLYQAETALIAQEQGALLDEARTTILSGDTLSRLEQNGVLHAIQYWLKMRLARQNSFLRQQESRCHCQPMIVFSDWQNSAS